MPNGAIPRRPIGRTELKVTEIGFGAAPLGNLYAPLSDDEARDTLAAALDGGIGYVDTAPYYGFGLSERRTGDAVRARSADVVISTKVGRLLTPAPDIVDDRERHGFRSRMPFEPLFDYSYDGVLRSFEASQQRLGLASIDILYVHDIGALTHRDDHPARLAELLNGGLRALEELRHAGAIKAFGIGVNEVAICEQLLDRAQLDVVLLAGRYTLLDQQAAALLNRALAESVSIVVGGPYNSGILAGDVGGGATLHFDYEPAPSPVIERARRLAAVCGRHDVPLRAAALRFALRHPAVASVIPGLASPAQVADTIALHARPIPEDLWHELVAERLLAPESAFPHGSTAASRN